MVSTRRAVETTIGEDHSLAYVLALAALGMSVATMTLTFGLDFGSF